MTADENAIAGKVKVVTQWASDKGGFVTFEGDNNDYYYFGKPKCCAGEQCTFAIAPGKGNFEDKVELKKKLSGPDEGSSTPPPTKTASDKFESAAQDGLTVYVDKQNLIIAQTCLKVAGKVVAGTMKVAEGDAWKDVGKVVCDLQDQFFTHIVKTQLGAKTNSKGK